MKKIVVSGFLALSLAAAVFTPETPASAKERQAIMLGTAVPLLCMNPGSSQDVSKTPIIRNNTWSVIPAGRMVTWETNNGDKGSFALTADLAPNATVYAHGGPGNGYQCSAHFTSMPDLMLSAVEWKDNNKLEVKVTNTDNWVGAEASVVRVEIMSCSGEVLQTYESAPTEVRRYETKELFFAAARPVGKTYLRVTADATKKVLERSETNNVYDGSSSCVH